MAKVTDVPAAFSGRYCESESVRSDTPPECDRVIHAGSFLDVSRRTASESGARFRRGFTSKLIPNIPDSRLEGQHQRNQLSVTFAGDLTPQDGRLAFH
jgi:hypothetical protein